MIAYSTLTLLLLAASSNAVALHKRTLAWRNCSDIAGESTTQYDCSTVTVPLDYTAPSNASLNLELVRIPALQTPAKGSILFNFGGPGAEARNSLVALAPSLQLSTGGIYDLVAFDPRGTGNTIPFNCSETALDLYDFGRKFVMGNSSDIAIGQAWAASQALNNRCKTVSGNIGSYLGTAFVARDLMSVVDALNEDGLLRFWGFSYGATLGQTVAAMFPDRMDKVVIDAVQNVHEYYDALGIVQQWTDSDKVFSGIWSTCIDASPELCPLAASYNSSANLESDVWELMYSLKEKPLTIGSSSFVLDYTGIKSLMVESLYTTASWPNTSSITHKLLKGENDDELYDLLANNYQTTPESELANGIVAAANMGIQCSDRRAKTNNLEDLLPVLNRIQNTSRIMGDVTDVVIMTCSQWKMPAKEIYAGGWNNVTTRNPILFVGNTYDGHTPLRSAYNASASFVDSVVLQIDGYGHGSVNLASKCAMNATAAYFVNGTLPAKGTICPIDLLPYHKAPES